MPEGKRKYVCADCHMTRSVGQMATSQLCKVCARRENKRTTLLNMEFAFRGQGYMSVAKAAQAQRLPYNEALSLIRILVREKRLEGKQFNLESGERATLYRAI